MKNNNRIFLGEFIGSSFLVMVIVGSGIMAENLTNDNALRLTANTLRNWCWPIRLNNCFCKYFRCTF